MRRRAACSTFFNGLFALSWESLHELIALSLIAVVFIQLGRTFSKKATDETEKHKKSAIYTTIALLIIVGTLAQKGLLFGTKQG